MPNIGNKLKQEENRKLLANPRVQAMLNTIAYAEGADYNTRVGGSTFDDLSKKPGKSTRLKSLGINSTAEGRYQFLNDTWNAVAKDLGLTDFSPQSQDIAAIELIKRRGALNDILEGDLTTAIPKLAKEWASLPTKSGKSAYGQRARSFESLRDVFEGGAHGSSYVGSGMKYKPQEEKEKIPTVFMPNYGSSASTNLAEEEQDTPEEIAAKQEIAKATEEKQLLDDYFSQSNQPTQEEQQFSVPQEPQAAAPSLLEQFAQVSSFVDQPITAQEGGIPISSQGVYEVGYQPVLVPTNGSITMKDVKHPILGVSLDTGEKRLMLPEEEYFFKNTQNILEIPQLKNYFNKK